MARLDGKIALVTGGASGIGRAIVERYAADGAKVVIGDIDVGGGEALARTLGEGALFVKLDVSLDTDWTAAMAAATRLGPLTTVVNNAGVSSAGSIASTTEAAWARTLNVNATGTFLGCRHAVTALGERGGAIINMASARGQRASAGQVAYCASKALILSLTQSVALYCAESGLPIRCNALCPGIVDTPILDETRKLMGGGAAAEARLGAMQPIGRLGRPEELASMAAYLASDEAAFITGATINVDGGFSIRDR